MPRYAQLPAILALWATASLVSLGAGQAHQGWTTDQILLDLAVETAGTQRDDATDWDDCARKSLAAWNTALAPTTLQFTARLGSARPPLAFDGRNSVAFTPDVFGLPFGPSLLSVTQTVATIRPGLHNTIEADVFVNHAAPFNCYRGAIPTPPVYDLQRTLSHALGHVVGLGHPDPARTVGPAMMDAHPGAVDTLQPPDIQGGLLVAGTAVTGLPFPPRNETLTFYESLETTYRDTLLRAQTNPGYVDAEGVAVWFPEWLRYVIHGCAAPEATTRVLMQIRGQGLQPVCEDVAPETVAFPPRNLSLDFLTQLDAFYRDELQRPVAWSHVDQEGKAVWLQEYLRYRVDGQSDTDAQGQVFTEIEDAASPHITLGTRVLVDILSPRGVSLPVVILSPAAPPRAAVILLEGDDGIISLSGSTEDPQIDSLGFLARNADAFAATGLLVALVGVPSDYETGIDINYRISSQQSDDIASVVAWIDARSSLPVWVLGMSLGSYSATNSAIRLSDVVDGFAVCSASTAPTGGPYSKGIIDMDLAAITMPSLVVGHRDDTCPGTPPEGVAAIAGALTSSDPIVQQLFSGGLPARSDACGPTSAHGYFGIDEEVVAFMAQTIR